jgi:hypothetical protein
MIVVSTTCWISQVLMPPPNSNTFRRGANRRIDFISGTKYVLQSVHHRGALAYNNGIVLDHWGLFVDFDPTILFGGTVANPVSMSSRGFTSKNAKKVTKYVDSLEQYWIDHKITECIARLTNEAKTLSRRDLRRHYDSVDRDITRGMLAAEKKVRPAEHKYHWSKMLDQAGHSVRYWKTRLSDLRNNSSSSPSLESVQEQAGIALTEHDSNQPLVIILENLSAATRDLKEVQRQDKANCHKSLHDCLPEAEQVVQDSNDPEAAQKAAKAIEAII